MGYQGANSEFSNSELIFVNRGSVNSLCRHGRGSAKSFPPPRNTGGEGNSENSEKTRNSEKRWDIWVFDFDKIYIFGIVLMRLIKIYIC